MAHKQPAVIREWCRLIVKVKVMEIDLPRKRIGLSMRLDDVPGEERSGAARGEPPTRDDRRDRGGNRGAPARKPAAVAAGNSAFADAFSRALKR